MSSVTSSIWIDRDSGTFDLSIDYWIDPYIDPETGEYFGDTSWTVSYGSGGTGGWGGEAGTVPINLGLAGGEDLVSSTLTFNAMNTFSGVSVEQQWNLLVAAYATGDLTANGSAGTDIVITGSGNDTVFGYDGNDILNTGDGDDTLDGGDGADQLDGGRGNDTLIGGSGDDFYMVDSAEDTAVELAGGGNDVVMSSVSYTLADEVEQLILNGVGPLDGTGNAGNNQLYGNHDINVLSGLAGQDLLSGYDGADTLYGGSGNDTLDGGGGDDTMDGGADDDIYIVDSAGDVTIELAGGGVDTVQVFGLADYNLGNEIENLTLLWGSDFHGTGNDLANVMTGGTGNDTLVGLGGEDVLQGGDGDDTLDGGADADQLVGGLGFDTASYAAASAGISVYLAVGGTRGDALGDTYTGIERIIGSAFADVIVGDAGENQLFGGAGDDRLYGGAGRDVLVGGAGADLLLGGGEDRVSYVGSTDTVVVDLATRFAMGGDATGDMIFGFVDASGGSGDDILAGDEAANSLFGDGGDDLIMGRGGDDTIEGGVGADALFGGQGFDLLSYASSTGGVTVDLGTGTAAGGDAQGDQYSGFEGVVGSAFADTIAGGPAGSSLAGGDGDDTLTGGDGDDTIEGGAGADLMDGGAGSDTLSYAGLGGWVSVSLPSGTAYQYFGTSDTFANFENVVGSAFGDAIYGDESANRIDGGGGGDFIAGYGGNDVLTGGEGDDFFYVDGNFGSDIILDFHAGADMEDEIGLGLGFDFDSFVEVMAVATQSGSDTILSFAPERQLTLVGVNLAALTPDDFYFN